MPTWTRFYRVADLLIDTTNERVTRGDAEIVLPRLSYALLLALVESAPYMVSTENLMRQVWPTLVVGPETVSQRVKLLRQALGDDARNPRYIEGIRGRGYRLVADIAADASHPPPAVLNRQQGMFSRRALVGAALLAPAVVAGGWIASRPPRASSALDAASPDPEAYSHYLRALVGRTTAAGAYGAQRNPAMAVEQELNTALMLDPGFAAAYAERMAIRMVLFLNNTDSSDRQLARIRDDLQMARRLAPQSPKTLAATALYDLFITGDQLRALASFKQAQAAGLADPMWMLDMVFLLIDTGRTDEGLALARSVLSVDPRNTVAIAIHAMALAKAQRPADALRATEYGLALYPQDFALIRSRAMLYLGWAGDIEPTRGFIAQLKAHVEQSQDPALRILFAQQLRVVGKLDEARSVLDEFGDATTPSPMPGAGQVPVALERGWVNLLRDDPEAAKKDGASILAFLQNYHGNRTSACVRPLLTAVAHTFRGNREQALAAARVALPLPSIFDQGRTKDRTLAAVFAWNGEDEAALGLLNALTRGPDSVWPGLITLDGAYTVPLGRSESFIEMKALLDDRMQRAGLRQAMASASRQSFAI